MNSPSNELYQEDPMLMTPASEGSHRKAAASPSTGRSPCSPDNGPTFRSTRSAGSPSEWGYDGLEIACWGDHFDVAQGGRG